MKPFIVGLSGLALTGAEADAILESQPAGFILFGRNIADPDQVRALTDNLRALTGRDSLPLLIDQEGGRVTRLGPPHWPVFPAAARFAALYDRAPMTAIEAARLNAEATGLLLSSIGITVNCAPVLDLHRSETHAAIADRCLGTAPGPVAALGSAVLKGFAAGGVAGVLKHMPGQGRATADSHASLPIVCASAEELEADIAPFKALAQAPIGMTSHVIYEAWDRELHATHSAVVIRDIIRGKVGFDGLLLSDDLHMEALSGSLEERAVGAIEAGCDLALACHATPEDMPALADALPDITEHSLTRLDRAVKPLSPPKHVDKIAALIAKRDTLLAYAT